MEEESRDGNAKSQLMLCPARNRTFPECYRDSALRLNPLKTTGKFCFRTLRKFI